MVPEVFALAAALLAAAAPAAAGTSAATAVAEGDLHYARRGQDARGAVADLAEIQAAIVQYRRARSLDPDSLPARIGLLRALFFRGGFCGESDAAQKASFEEAKRLAEDSMAWLEARAAALGAGPRRERLVRVPGAGALSLWSAVAWGQWSMDHKISAAWQGAAGRIRALSGTAIALDAGYEEGSPYLVLGRLHAESPRIPLLTGWISREKALENLRRAHAISPRNSVAQYFLAEAILDFEPKSRPEAIRLLETCASQEPRPEYLVEDRHYAEQARARLAALRP